MPSFDLRGIRAGKYKNTSGTVTYTEPTDVGDAMSAQLELKFAEGRLYAESKLAEYIKLATGGTISLLSSTSKGPHRPCSTAAHPIRARKI